jgi:di/tripeptidase
VSGATLLNLDSEEDGKLTVGSASSTDTSIRVEKPREACGAGAVTLSVSVSGGLGGHSGTDIAHGRANAIQCLRASRACRRARCPARLAGGSLEIEQADPGWRPKLDSPVLDVTRRVYERLFGEAPIITAVHAWLETAVIGDRVPGLDMLSFSPQIEAPHSPDERVNIPTVERFWLLLAGVVDEFSTHRGVGRPRNTAGVSMSVRASDRLVGSLSSRCPTPWRALRPVPPRRRLRPRRGRPESL